MTNIENRMGILLVFGAGLILGMYITTQIAKKIKNRIKKK
tara:strand:- start:1817 stop:1936 length:120 start_codon:yes stop_codon:yes gene_type:complete